MITINQIKNDEGTRNQIIAYIENFFQGTVNVTSYKDWSDVKPQGQVFVTSRKEVTRFEFEVISEKFGFIKTCETVDQLRRAAIELNNLRREAMIAKLKSN